MKSKNDKKNIANDKREIRRQRLKERRENQQNGHPAHHKEQSFLKTIDAKTYKHSIDTFNEKQMKEKITDLFLGESSHLPFRWKKVAQPYYFTTINKIEEIPKLWQQKMKNNATNDKFLLFCKPYVEYLPYFLEDIAANASEGFILNKYIYLNEATYDYLEGYALLRKYLEKK